MVSLFVCVRVFVCVCVCVYFNVYVCVRVFVYLRVFDCTIHFSLVGESLPGYGQQQKNVLDYIAKTNLCWVFFRMFKNKDCGLSRVGRVTITKQINGVSSSNYSSVPSPRHHVLWAGVGGRCEKGGGQSTFRRPLRVR